MSSFTEHMERRNSTHSYSSIEGSEIGSRYLLESGFYMTSVAATIFIGALITVGVLFITLLIALAVMLQSCQNKSAGFVQLQKPSDAYDYCRIFALHAELNRLEADAFPTVCHAYATEGRYLQDLKLTVSMAKSYFSGLVPKDSLDVVLMDIDDMFLSDNPKDTSVLLFGLVRHDGTSWVEEAKRSILLELYAELQRSGWSLVYITRKPEKQRNTIKSLISVGFVEGSTLIMRSDEEMKLESWDYFSRKRTDLWNQGFHIRSVISSRMDALTGPYSGKRNFKLADPTYLLKSDAKKL